MARKKKPVKEEVEFTDADLAEVDALLDDAVIEDVGDAELDAVAREIDSEESKAEAYAEMEGESEPVPEMAAETTPTKRSRATFEKASDNIFHRLGDKADDFTVLVKKDADRDVSERREEVVELVDGLAKKVREKAVNLFDGAANGRKLSNYTRIALRELLEREEMSVMDLKRVYGADYSPGTSNSQAHQIMQLLPALKIARKDGKSLKVNEDSVLVDHLREMVT